jgi:hypothetical protein
MAKVAEAYKDHRAGSNKGEVHKAFDKEGAESAMKMAKKLGIMDATARTWISSWKTKTGGAKKAAKKASVKKAAPKSAAAKKTTAKKTTAKKAPAKRAAKAAQPAPAPDAS